MWEYFAPNQAFLKVKDCRKGKCIRVDGRGVAIDRLISSHIRSIGTLGPTFIRSKISAAWNTLKFAQNTLDLKFKYSATEQLTALNWFFGHCHGVSTSFKTNMKLVGLKLDEIHNFNWKHTFEYPSLTRIPKGNYSHTKNAEITLFKGYFSWLMVHFSGLFWKRKL